MAEDFKVTILNERQFTKAMADAGPKLAAAMKSTLTYCAVDLVEKPAAVLAQRNFLHPTGNLPSSIYSEFAPSGLQAKVTTNLVYAPLREFGGNVSTPWPGSGAYHTIHHVGRPFLTKAFNEAKNKIHDKFDKTIERVLKEVDQEAGG